MIRRAGAVIALSVAALSGCGLWRPVSVPMASIREPASCATRPDTLLVMLPGSYSRPEDFMREGFVAAVRERRIAADIVLVDAHLGYYADKSVIERLRADIVEPARAQGYAQIWLVGISVGAFGAMIYSQAQPAGITGIVALGPYLGQRTLTEQINAQGGLRRWRAPVGPLDPNDIDETLWRWLQAGGDVVAGAARPDLYLGYGLDDRFVFSDRLLADVLPPERVFTTDGGHDWAPWLALWQRMLDAMPLKRGDDCRVAIAP